MHSTNEHVKPHTLEVLYEDNHFIAIYKRPGMIAQADASGDVPMGEYIKSYLKVKYQKPGNVFVGICHRLDRPVSGVIVFAKTSKGLFRMNDLFKHKQIKKTYYAVVREMPPQQEGRLVHWLSKDNENNITVAYPADTPGALKSELHYQWVGEVDGFHLIKVNPLTGRSHQIRTQLASMGCPIVGDNKYGYKRGNRDRSICLHAFKLEFEHPIKKEFLKIIAPLPGDDFWQKFNHLVEE